MIHPIAVGSTFTAHGHGKLVHYSTRALNLRFGDRILTIQSSNGVLTPSSVILDIKSLPIIEDATFDGASFISDKLTFRIVERVDMRLPETVPVDSQYFLNCLEPYVLQKKNSIMEAYRTVVLGQLPKYEMSSLENSIYREQINVLSHSKTILSAVRDLLGKGFGFTPSGDDFAVGVISVLSALNIDTKEFSRLFSSYGYEYSRTMLLDATNRNYSEPLLELLKAAQTQTISQDKVQRLLRTGHSSGYDTLCGIIYSLKKYQEGYRK
ncbi:MAG: DUF2877 domain-containing protein [Thermoplasmatales archaeon]